MASQDRAGFGDHRRDRESGRLVYPVLSRRSGGLSVGVNLFPDAKRCNFDCPYCEVFPFEGSAPFSAQEFERELDLFLDTGYPELWRGEPIRDLCLSGNGEPTLSPLLDEALDVCARARRAHPALLGRAKIVVITNSTGFLSGRASSALARAVAREGAEVWAKLDGGTPEAFARMSRSAYCLPDIVSGIASFAASSRVVVQTMLCASGGAAPSDPEVLAYARILAGLASGGARISQVHLYTKARPSPEAGTSGLPDGRLAELGRLVASASGLPVRAFGSEGELRLAPERGVGL